MQSFFEFALNPCAPSDADMHQNNGWCTGVNSKSGPIFYVPQEEEEPEEQEDQEVPEVLQLASF